MTTLVDIKDRIHRQQQLFLSQYPTPNGVSGTAFRFIPAKLNEAELPAFMTRTDAADYSRPYGEESFQETRTFLLELFVANLAHGAEGDVEALTEPYYKRVQDFWEVRPRLEHIGDDALDDVDHAELVGDVGTKATRFPNIEGAVLYAVLQFRLAVTWERQIFRL